MREMINNYLEKLEKMDKKNDLNALKDDLLVHISFYQHERLIHFLVTMLVAIITTILLISTLIIDNILLLIILIIFVLLLIPYMFHYYFLENSVQDMYRVYDKIIDKLKK